PYQRLAALRRFAFCCTFRGLAPPRRYLAPCPLEPGLSSPNRKVRGDCLASSRRYLSSHRPPAPARAARRRRQCLLPPRRGPSSMNNRRKMVIAAAGAIAVALPLLAAERLAVKTGLWENTVTMHVTGVTLPTEQLEKMPAAQRAQV